jgi:hypothetical protein
MQRISMDTIGPLAEVMTFKFIIVFIDTFTRYVELFLSNTVCAISAGNALWKHICRFCTPLEILTDQGTQFMNQTLTHLASVSDHLTIAYSKDENGIVERANKEVNRHIRNILADEECIPDWPQMLCMTEKLLNSVKHALGVLLFGDAIPTEQSLLAEIDRIPTATPPRTIRDYVDKLMDRQSRLIVAAQKSQQKVNADNLEKRYSTYPRTPKGRRIRETTIRPPRVHSFGTKRASGTPAQKWVMDPNDQPFIGPLNQGEEEPQRFYIPLLPTKSPVTVVDTIDQIDLHPYELTKYEVNDYVLRRFPSTKIGDGNPDKYGSY